MKLIASDTEILFENALTFSFPEKPILNLTSSLPKPNPRPMTAEIFKSSKTVPSKERTVSLTFIARPKTFAIIPTEASALAILLLPVPIRLDITGTNSEILSVIPSFVAV